MRRAIALTPCLLAVLAALPAAQIVPRHAALERSPAELARAEPGRWSGLFRGTELDADMRDALDPAVVTAMQQAEAAYMAEDYPAALEQLFTALDRAPDFPPALLLLGNTYYRLRRHQDLVLALQRFVEVAPDQLYRTQALGHGLYTLGDYPAARAHYGSVVAAMSAHGIPVSVEAKRGLALSEVRLGDSARALELLREIVAERPADADARAWIAEILLDQEQLEDAREAAATARSLDPYEPRPWFLLSRILLELGLDSEADVALARWKVLDRAAQTARALEARILYSERAFEAALELADLERSLGNADGVRQAFERALVRKPADVSEVELRVNLMRILDELGDKAGAARAASELERRCAGEREAWQALLIHFRSTGDKVSELRALNALHRLP